MSGDSRITSYNVCYTKLLRTKKGALYVYDRDPEEEAWEPFANLMKSQNYVEYDRITSYNVCYTKLLRGVRQAGRLLLFTKINQVVQAIDKKIKTLSVGTNKKLMVFLLTVITSYSIHYTKLYEGDRNPVRDLP